MHRTPLLVGDMLSSARLLGQSIGKLPRACLTLTPHRPQLSPLLNPHSLRALSVIPTNPSRPSPDTKSTTLRTSNSLHFAQQRRTMSYTPRDGDPVLPLFSLKGKSAIVTGAGAGIGYAVADCFAEAGADVIIWYNSNPKAHEAAEEIAKRWGVKCKAFKVDVTDQQAVDSAVKEQVEGELGGRLDIFVANAGIPWTKGAILDVGQEGVEHYKKVVATDLDSVYYSALATGKYFKKQGSGSFIATASMSGHIVNIPQMQTAYNAVKAGVIHYCRGLAVEWAGFARVNSISPGYIATEISAFASEDTKKVWRQLTPLKREGLANELKGAYLYLASDASTFTTGSDIKVDGGYCLP